MKIGVDIDDVIADLIPAILDFAREKRGIIVRKKEFDTQDYSSVFKISQEESRDLVKTFIELQGLEELTPMSDSQDVLNKISKNHDLFAITSRIPLAEKPTLEWLEEKFPSVFAETLFSINSYDVTKRKLNKKDICLDLGIDIMVEDDISYASLFENCGIEVLLFDQPWNQVLDEKKHPHITRVFNWREISRKIDSLEKNT